MPTLHPLTPRRAVPAQVLTAVIPRRTREQLQLFTRAQRGPAAEALLQWVPAEQLPAKYGGTCSVELGDSPLERAMAQYVRQLGAAAPDAVAAEKAVGGDAGPAQAAAATKVAPE